MNLDTLKKQAARLSAYLGAKHRVNLKHASVLEAIASVHGARNWQTLAAQAETGRAAPVEAAADRRSHPREALRPLTWRTQDEPVLVPQAQWCRHAIAYGAADDINTWAGHHLAHCLQFGQAGLFLDMSFGDTPPLRPVLDQGALLIDLRAGDGPKYAPPVGQGDAVTVNLLDGLSAVGVKELLSAFFREAGFRPEQRTLLGEVVEALAAGLLAVKQPVTIDALLEHTGSSDKVARLRDGTQGDAREALDLLFAAGGLPAQLIPLAGVLEGVRAAPLGKFLFSSAPDAVSVPDLLSREHAVIVQFPGGFAARAHWYQVWIAVMADFGRQRFSATSPSHNAPVAFVLPDLAVVDRASFTPLLHRARVVNVALLMGRPSATRPSALTAEAEMNAFNHVYLGDEKKRAEAEVLRRLAEASSVVLTRDSVQF